MARSFYTWLIFITVSSVASDLEVLWPLAVYVGHFSYLCSSYCVSLLTRS